jgi:hypothetical protein
MSAPWLKFYPSDWRADPALRMCSMAARGLWVEMLCLMHEAEPYGSLRVNKQPVNDKQLASLCGVSVKDVSKALEELETAGVFSRDDHGVVYSRRMVRDKANADRDKENGRGGGNPNLTKGVNPPDNGVDKAHIPEPRIQNPERPQVRNFGGAKAKGWSPPKHGATGRGRVYITQNTVDWQAYADDYRTAHKRDPIPNEHGGKWFKVLGEEAPDLSWAEKQIEARG